MYCGQVRKSFGTYPSTPVPVQDLSSIYLFYLCCFLTLTSSGTDHVQSTQLKMSLTRVIKEAVQLCCNVPHFCREVESDRKSDTSAPWAMKLGIPEVQLSIHR